MTAFTHRLVATATFALLGLICLALPIRAQTLDEIYAGAKAEGAFVFYVGGPTAPWEAMARIFEQRYPGIKVLITGGVTTAATGTFGYTNTAELFDPVSGTFALVPSTMTSTRYGHTATLLPDGKLLIGCFTK